MGKTSSLHRSPDSGKKTTCQRLMLHHFVKQLEHFVDYPRFSESLSDNDGVLLVFVLFNRHRPMTFLTRREAGFHPIYDLLWRAIHIVKRRMNRVLVSGDDDSIRQVD